MIYDEEEEIESTKEWLIKFNSTGYSEELLYVPSQLSKLGVAPIDVADKLNWLREHGTVKEPVETENALMEGNDLDFPSCDPWEWVDEIERSMADSIKSLYTPEPGLDQFNKLPPITTMRRPEPAPVVSRRRARRAKAVASLEPIRDNELAST